MQNDTELKSICSKFFADLKRINNEQEQIYFTVLYFIHSVAPHLSVLYLKWTNLNMYEKFILNTQIKQCLSKVGRTIYPPIIRAFEHWDIIQDKHGAPGFKCNPLRTELSEEMDKEIADAMFLIDKTINQIRKKKELLTEFLTHSDRKTILGGYKWWLHCKILNRKRSYLTQMVNSRGTDTRIDEEDYATDLNGCGDTTWLSENN